MSCEEVQLQLLARSSDPADPAQESVVQRHLEACADCRSFQRVAQGLIHLPMPTPSPDLERRFLARLAAERPARPHSAAWFNRPWALAAAASLLLGFGGYQLGRLQAPHAPSFDPRTQGLMTMVRSDSPQERVKGLAMIGSGDDRLADTLLTVMDRDPDIKVRLAAVEAFYLFGDVPDVRHRLAEAIPHQTSPTVQVAMVDLVMSWRNRAAMKALQHLIQEGKLSPEGQRRVQSALSQVPGGPV